MRLPSATTKKPTPTCYFAKKVTLYPSEALMRIKDLTNRE